MFEVDAAFIQPVEHRPNLEISEAKGIPLINLSPVKNCDPTDAQRGLKELIQEVGSACKDWGFFQVINHGVPAHVQHKIKLEAKKFFDLSSEEKRKVIRDEANPMGYYDSEHTKNVRDWKEVFDFTVADPTLLPASHLPDDLNVQEVKNQWPDNAPELRCGETSFQDIGASGTEFGITCEKAKWLDQTSFMRLNHYPPCPSPELALGVNRHKDSGALTVLAQDDVGGLDVKRKSDGEWVRVKPIPDTYIINVGDIIQVWSNDKYESAEHRAMVNSEKERFSIPFFFNPSHYVMVKPLQELTDEKSNPAKYREYNWGKFTKTKKLSNFKKLDVENIQISHFKISG